MNSIKQSALINLCQLPNLKSEVDKSRNPRHPEKRHVLQFKHIPVKIFNDNFLCLEPTIANMSVELIQKNSFSTASPITATYLKHYQFLSSIFSLKCCGVNI
jgi:hypothetical protein